MKKSEYVEMELKKAISRGEWNVGDKILSEEKLAERYQVSRLSVRTAISTLAAQGILESHRGKGTFICSTEAAPVPAAVEAITTAAAFTRTDMYEFRRIMEPESVALAASRATEEDILRMENFAKQLQHAKTAEDAIEADFNFHYEIIKATKNAVIIETFKALMVPYRQMFSLNVKLRGSAGADDHYQIILAIRTRNSKQAKSCMENHIIESMVMENTYLKEQD